jgi:hypothetical protein
MPRRFLRFRLRSSLLVVALVALALGFELHRRRWAAYRALARHHAEYEEGCFWSGQQCLDNVVEYERRRRRFVEQGDTQQAQICVENSAPFAAEAKRLFQQAEYHGRMKHDYASRW